MALSRPGGGRDGPSKQLQERPIGFICRATHTSTRHVGQRAAVVRLVERSGSVIACSGSFCAEEELSSGEPIDDVHGSVAKRSVPEGRLDIGGC